MTSFPRYLTHDFDYFSEKENAISTLANALNFGHLSILLGSGVSKSAISNFPNWIELVEGICTKAGITFDKTQSLNNTYLLERTELVKLNKPKEYTNITKEALFNSIVYDNEVLKKDLLLSLGSLMMISINRGSGSFINFNFDDLFEWYLEYHGYGIQIVSDPISLTNNLKPTIYHPHGFLPLTPKYKNQENINLIFSKKDYLESMRLDTPWSTILQRILSSKFILMIGLSGEDMHIEATCLKIYNDVLKKQRYLGFIVLPDTDEAKEKEKYNLSNGLINLYINHKQLPKDLLKICRLSQGNNF